MTNKRPTIIVAGLAKKGAKYLLIKEVLASGKPYWIIPGGHLEFGETLEIAVKREIKEEVNLEAQDLAYLGFNEAVFPNYNYHSVIFCFLVKKFKGQLEIKEKDQILDAKFFTRDEALKLDLVESARWIFEEKLA